MTRPLIVLTNDDGIASPGLAAAAAALDIFGDLLIVAPGTQQSGMGRSMPGHHDGRLFDFTVRHGEKSWQGYSANASPAQAVQHALLDIADRNPALLVSGINYGENLGVSVTISGTVGAALEGAAYGIPSLAISLETDPSLHLSHDTGVDFSTAAHFTALFAARVLAAPLPPDVDALKIDVPARATPRSPWRLTRLERKPYYLAVPARRDSLDAEGRIGYRLDPQGVSGEDTDVAVLLRGEVTVTPLSLDMTSRVEMSKLRDLLS